MAFMYRDENEQASYMLELLQIFEAEKVDAVFLTSFAAYNLPHREDPVYDLDVLILICPGSPKNHLKLLLNTSSQKANENQGEYL